MRSQTFVKHAAVYGLGSMLVQAGAVVLIPLYARCMSRTDFGVLEVVTRCAEMVSTLLAIGGLRQALVTFYQQSNGDAERANVVRAAMSLLLCVCLVGGGLALLLAGPLSGCLSQEGQTVSPGLLRLAVLCVLLEPLALLPLALIQARIESVTFVAITFSQFVVRVTLCALLAAGLGWGVFGVLTATVLTTGLYGAVLSARELFRGGGRTDWRKAVGLLRFALPFLPGGLCFFILQHGDRLFLLAFRGNDAVGEVGEYGLGYKVALAVGMFTLSPLLQVWSAHLYKAAAEPDAPVVFGRTFTRILGAFVLVGLAMCLFQEEIVAVLGNGRIAGCAASVVAPVVLAGFCQTAASLMDAGFYVRRRTGLKLAITLGATAVILVLYRVLIPLYGPMGAALATLGGFASLAAGTWWATQRIFPVRYEWGRLAALLGLAVVLWLASRLLPTGGGAMAVKAGLWLLLPLLLWVGGAVSREEKRLARAGLRQALAVIRRRPALPDAPLVRAEPPQPAAKPEPDGDPALAPQEVEALVGGGP